MALFAIIAYGFIITILQLSILNRKRKEKRKIQSNKEFIN